MKKFILILIFLIFISCKDDYRQSNLCGNENRYTGEFTVLTLNRLDGTSLNSVIRLIQDLNPDIIGLQESYGVGLDVASSLDYCYYGSDDSSTAFLSKYEIEVLSDDYSRIHFDNEKTLNFFNVHFTAYPYQPYEIRDGNITSVWEIEHQAEETRRDEFESILMEMSDIIKDEEILLVGDFNEPSHLDWTFNAAEQGLNFGLEINWPISNSLQSIGLTDAYRQFYSNEIDFPGHTWTTIESDDEVHDRIDYIYYSGQMDLIDISIVGPDHLSDLVIDYYESDHRAIFAKFKF